MVFEARGRGLGTELMRNLMSLANKQGHKQMSLGVDDANPRAHRFYERLGFEEVGRQKDGITMVADLGKPIPDPAQGA